jgi:L-rhamnose mutarotase
MGGQAEPHVRGVFALRLFPGVEAAFERRCQELPTMVGEAPARAGILRWVWFRLGTDVWVYGHYRDDAAAALERLARDPDYGRWLGRLRDIVADPATPTFYDEVFHTDAGPGLEPPMERGMLSLVIDPQQADVYDELHAHPWPDLTEALARSGIRAYSGFRRGAHVLYYGEFYPDMRAAFARMSSHEVDARWGRALDGVITTIRGVDGWLFTADEILRFEAEPGTAWSGTPGG